MIEINANFVEPYVTKNDMSVVNKDINEYLTSPCCNNVNRLHMNIMSYNRSTNNF